MEAIDVLQRFSFFDTVIFPGEKPTVCFILHKLTQHVIKEQMDGGVRALIAGRFAAIYMAFTEEPVEDQDSEITELEAVTMNLIMIDQQGPCVFDNHLIATSIEQMSIPRRWVELALAYRPQSASAE
jgi:hypothetical protein